MIKIADYNELQILTINLNGCYLDGGSESIFLDSKEMPEDVDQGDYIEVFLYTGKDGKVEATTEVAPATVNGYGTFEVRKKQDYGCFLDWGIGRDLFMPKRLYRTEFEDGDFVVVKIIPDDQENSVIATEKFIHDLEDADVSDLKEKDEVDLIVFELTELGARVIINDGQVGMLYKNEIFEELSVGDKRTGYIKKVREDEKIDVALQKQGFKEAVGGAQQQILQALEDNDGTLCLGDKSDPEAIKKVLKMSKKMFKRTIGGLYKEGKVIITNDTVSLKKDE